MISKLMRAALLLAATTALAAAPASAAIIKGYTDLYVTSMSGWWEQYGDDTQSGDWARCSGLCAKVRFAFSQDTERPPYETTVSLELLKDYDGWLLPTRTINGKRYLPLQPYSFGNISKAYPLLGPSPAPGEFSGPREHWRTDSFRFGNFVFGPPGPGFRLNYFADRIALWGEYPCSPDDPWHFDQCRNVEGASPGQSEVGPFFASRHFIRSYEVLSISNVGYGAYEGHSDDFHELAFDHDIGFVSRIRYTFDNDPVNWIDGPPKACTWIAGGTGDDEDPCGQAVSEPATLGLLGLGLAGLGVVAMGGAHRR